MLTGEIREAPESLRETYPDVARVTTLKPGAPQRTLF
jgi:hypothetical protein